MNRRFTMLIIVISFICLVSLAYAEGESKFDLVGAWEGHVNASGGPIRVVFRIKQTADGGYRSTLDQPDRKEFGIKADVTVVQGRKFHFEAKQYGIRFDGVINDKGYLVGVWKQTGETLPLILERESIID